MRYRKKSAYIEAVRLSPKGDMPDGDLLSFIGRAGSNVISFDPDRGAHVVTPEGIEHGRPGDWIIKGECGVLYPCRDELFRTLYERVD